MVTENKLVVSTVSGTGAGFGYKGVIEGNLGSGDEIVRHLDCDSSNKHSSKCIELDTKKLISLYLNLNMNWETFSTSLGVTVCNLLGTPVHRNAGQPSYSITQSSCTLDT